jgi:hypothetical protein
MDIRRAFTYLFHDPHGRRKLALAMMVNLVPVLITGWGLFTTSSGAIPMLGGSAPYSLWSVAAGLTRIPLNGFLLRITRNVVNGVDVPLPAWTDVGDLLRDGVKLWAVITLWSLPHNLVRSAADAFAIPALLIDVIVLVVLFVLPAAEVRLAITESLRAGLDVVAAFRTVQRNLGDYLRLALVDIGATLVTLAVSAGLVLLVRPALTGVLDFRSIRTSIIVIITVWGMAFGPYLSFVSYHLAGQAFARSLRIRDGS